MKPIRMPKISARLARKGAIPVAMMAALTSPLAYQKLDQFEGTIKVVYEDRLARNIPTFCAGRTDWTAVPGTQLTDDFCKVVDKITLIQYGYEVFTCVEWRHLLGYPERIVGLTMFTINVGPTNACGSQAFKAINAGDIHKGCNLIAYKTNGRPNWSYANGVYVPGLYNRRRGETDLCLRGMV
jgi:lysozyme